jgi:hypothetical protein
MHVFEVGTKVARTQSPTADQKDDRTENNQTSGGPLFQEAFDEKENIYRHSIELHQRLRRDILSQMRMEHHATAHQIQTNEH